MTICFFSDFISAIVCLAYVSGCGWCVANFAPPSKRLQGYCAFPSKISIPSGYFGSRINFRERRAGFSRWYDDSDPCCQATFNRYHALIVGLRLTSLAVPSVPPPDLMLFEVVCRNCWSSSIIFGAALYSATWVFGAIASWPMASRCFVGISIGTQAHTTAASKGSPPRQVGLAVSVFAVCSKRRRLSFGKLHSQQRRAEHKQDQNTTCSLAERKYQGIVAHFPAMCHQPDITQPIEQ